MNTTPMSMLRRLVTLSAAAVALALLTAGCSMEPASSRVKVEVNHCFVKPVSFDGEQWNVLFKNQFGWGGMEPKGRQDAGVMVRAGESKARFEDDDGATIVFRPVDDPSVRPVETAPCS